MSYVRKRPYHRFMPDRSWDIIHAAVETAINRAGSASAFCRGVKVPRSTLARWRYKDRLPTLEHAVRIERVTGVSRKSIRPDIDWEHVNEKMMEEDLSV